MYIYEICKKTCTYVELYMHICRNVCIYVYTYVDKFIYIHIYMRVQLYVCINISIYTLKYNRGATETKGLGSLHDKTRGTRRPPAPDCGCPTPAVWGDRLLACRTP